MLSIEESIAGAIAYQDQCASDSRGLGRTLCRRQAYCSGLMIREQKDDDLK